MPTPNLALIQPWTACPDAARANASSRWAGKCGEGGEDAEKVGVVEEEEVREEFDAGPGWVCGSRPKPWVKTVELTHQGRNF